MMLRYEICIRIYIIFNELSKKILSSQITYYIMSWVTRWCCLFVPPAMYACTCEFWRNLIALKILNSLVYSPDKRAVFEYFQNIKFLSSHNSSSFFSDLSYFFSGSKLHRLIIFRNHNDSFNHRLPPSSIFNFSIVSLPTRYLHTNIFNLSYRERY